MNSPSILEEKKECDQVGNDASRLERLELMVEILYKDLFQVKEQQLRSQKQVLDLQADLAAAELAREDAERQMEQLQLRDHQLLLSLGEKQQQQQEELHAVKLTPHVRMNSISRSTKSQNVDLIDVTSYEENVSDYERKYDQLYHVDDIQPEESSCDQYILQLWEELSSSIQHLSSDLIEQRDAFEFVWTKFQMTSNQRITALEQASAIQLDALKGMAIEWDIKLTELNDQVQKLNHEFSNEKASTTDMSHDIDTKLQSLAEQLIQLQSSLQHQIDLNRYMNGERLVMKRDHEVQIRKLCDTVQNLNTMIHEQADQIRQQASVPTSTGLTNTNPPPVAIDEMSPKPVDEKEGMDNVDDDDEILDVIVDDPLSTLASLAQPTVKVDDPDDDNGNPQQMSTLARQRCLSF